MISQQINHTNWHNKANIYRVQITVMELGARRSKVGGFALYPVKMCAKLYKYTLH